MKRKLLTAFFTLILLGSISTKGAFAINEVVGSSPYDAQTTKSVGIAKYAVLEIIEDWAPIRLKPDENSKRITHLFKGAVLFSDSQIKEYYRIELEKTKGKPDYYWISKKFVEVQGVIPEKRFEDIEKITFKNETNRYDIYIKTNTKGAFIIEDKPTGLDFTLYDNHFDPTGTKIIGKKSQFSLSDKIENKLEIKYSTKKPLFGYKVQNYEDGYIYTIKKPPSISNRRPLKNLIVVVDPGHGGIEKGACAFHLEEKTLNLQISKKLAHELRKRGAKVFLTRKNDEKIGLYERIDFAKEKNADIFISIHQNSLPNTKYLAKKHGVGTYYYNNQSKLMAQNVENSLVQNTGFRFDGVNNASFAVIRPTDFISILVECGYIIKADEAEKLADKKFQKVIAKSIVEGAENYLREAFGKK